MLIFIIVILMCKNAKFLGMLIIRLWIGWVLLMAGLGKIMSASPEMIANIGWVAHSLGGSFLSTTVWFRLVAWGEALAGLLFIIGLCVPVASLLTVIIMTVAFFAVHQWNIQEGMSALLVGVVSLWLGFTGPWMWSIKWLCRKSCNWGSCKGSNCGKLSPEKTDVVSL